MAKKSPVTPSLESPKSRNFDPHNRLLRLRIDHAVHVNDKVPDICVVYRSLGLAPPGPQGGLIVGVNPHQIQALGIDELRATTRDILDYDVLMRQRLRLLEQHQLGLEDIRGVISTISPMPGAREFIDWLRERFQVVILSDTLYEFSQPLMAQLGYPTLLCYRPEACLLYKSPHPRH